MQHFRYSIVVTLVCFGLAYLWGSNSIEGGVAAVALVLLLGVMEVSLSFDNAVVNASVLKEMDAKWRQIFLTVGILIAVFGMRLLFSILVVPPKVMTCSSPDGGVASPASYASSMPDRTVGFTASQAGARRASHCACSAMLKSVLRRV